MSNLFEYAHPTAKKIFSENFFWDETDELSPFGSYEGDIALLEFRRWRKLNSSITLLHCIKWVIESIGQISLNEYILSIDISKKYSDEDLQLMYTLDISVIATGFGQLIDEGLIDEIIIPYIEHAIHRQTKLAQKLLVESDANTYISNLSVLKSTLIYFKKS